MAMPRHFRRSSSPRPVIQSFKKVLNFAGTSQSAGTTIQKDLVIGVDSVAAGQTGVTDANVPTGAIVKYIEITLCVTNLVAVSDFVHVAIQQLHSGQTKVSPQTVGGNPQRNQVFFQQMFSVGKEQNSTHVYRFKIPKKFQRVREGDKWIFTSIYSVVSTDILQAIYKFYR